MAEVLRLSNLVLQPPSKIITPEWASDKERPREECGIFGIFFPHPEFCSVVARTTLAGLNENQHRGEESAGFAVADGSKISRPFKAMGSVKNLYHRYETLDDEAKREIKGHIAVAHTRYSTTGSSKIENAGPFSAESEGLGQIVVAHNGNITNADKLKTQLESQGVSFTSTTDSEVIAHLISKSQGATWEEKIISALKRLEGSFSLVMCTKDHLYGTRDPIGNRPLSFSQFRTDGQYGYALSSESPAFDSLGIKYQREINPGELIEINTDGYSSVNYVGELPKQAFCGLEFAYLMRPDSRINAIQMEIIREHLGEALALRYPPPPDIDFVTYVPESAKSSSVGYARKISELFGRQIPQVVTLLKNRYGSLDAVRGFIQPNQERRMDIARYGYHPFDSLIGAKIVLVDDSIIRGTTTKGVIEIVKKRVGAAKNQGAKEIHLRIVFPQVISHCPLGTDIDQSSRLIARDLKEISEIAEELGVDSLAFLTPDEFQEAVNEALNEDYPLCLGCTTGKYPVEHSDANKTVFEQKKC